MELNRTAEEEQASRARAIEKVRAELDAEQREQSETKERKPPRDLFIVLAVFVALWFMYNTGWSHGRQSVEGDMAECWVWNSDIEEFNEIGPITGYGAECEILNLHKEVW